jgi:hypothetical protein
MFHPYGVVSLYYLSIIFHPYGVVSLYYLSIISFGLHEKQHNFKDLFKIKEIKTKLSTQ